MSEISVSYASSERGVDCKLYIHTSLGFFNLHAFEYTSGGFSLTMRSSFAKEFVTTILTDVAFVNINTGLALGCSKKMYDGIRQLQAEALKTSGKEAEHIERTYYSGCGFYSQECISKIVSLSPESEKIFMRYSEILFSIFSSAELNTDRKSKAVAAISAQTNTDLQSLTKQLRPITSSDQVRRDLLHSLYRQQSLGDIFSSEPMNENAERVLELLAAT